MDRSVQTSAGVAVYTIRVRGHVDAAWCDWFDGLQITNQPDGQATLQGPVVDQTALYGLLSRLRDLNLELIELKRLRPWKPTPPMGRPR